MLPSRPPRPLTPVRHEVLRRCDGIRSARDLPQEPGPDVDVAAVLAGLAARRLVARIARDFDSPTYVDILANAVRRLAG